MPSLKNPVMTKSIFKNFKIGDYTYGRPKIIGDVELEIGKFCSIDDEVTIVALDNRPHCVTTYPFQSLFKQAQHIPETTIKASVHIGNDVLIRYGATILSGITIGNGAIIGASSIVGCDVAPYSIVAGNPAQHMGYRFAEEWIDLLNRKIKWWEWPIDTILERIDDLLQAPGDHLLKYSKRYGG